MFASSSQPYYEPTRRKQQRGTKKKYTALIRLAQPYAKSMLHANIPSYNYLYSQLQAGKQQKIEEGE